MEKFCDFFSLRPTDLITTLTYVLMDNFCPCFSFTFFTFSLQEKKIICHKKKKRKSKIEAFLVRSCILDKVNFVIFF